MKVCLIRIFVDLLLYIITTNITTFNNIIIIIIIIIIIKRAYQTCFYSIRTGDFTHPEFIGTSEYYPKMQVYFFRALF